MKLISLELINFKNIKHFVLEANGLDKNIYGKNGVGKTTLADAYYWLITDKSSLDKKLDENIKLADPLTGNAIQDGGVEHTVNGLLELDNGKRVVLSKIYKEKWTKQNGQPNKCFTGHVISYVIDGVARSKKEYNKFIEDNICNIDIFKIVSSTVFFNNMQWKKQREILLDVCGDITDTDVINSDKRLAQLPDILQGKNINDFIEIISARKKKINNELDRIPIRIDETTKQLDDLGELPDCEAIKNELKDLRDKQDKARGTITAINNGSEINSIKNKINEIKNRMLQIKTNCEFNNKELEIKEQKQKSEFGSNIEMLNFQIESWNKVISENNIKKQEISDKLTQYRKEYSDVFKSVFNEKDAICPTCGQVLPQEKIDEAIKNFNTNRANRLREINESGKKLSIQSKEINNQNSELLKRISEYKNKILDIKSKMDDIDKKIEILNSTDSENASYIDDDEYKNLRTKLISVNKNLNDIQTDNISQIKNLNKVITQLDLDINNRMEKLTLIAQAEKFKNRINELKTQNKKLGGEFEILEQHLNLIRLFITKKVSMLTNKINIKFGIARFKLFEQQINGGIQECCEAITINGASFNNSMSNGERVKVGIDICSTLAKHYGVNVPIFVDNAESVTDMQDIEEQKILLIVSHHDELTVKEPYKK